jgi:hypothetical protein
MRTLRKRLQDVIVRDVDREVLLLDLESNQIHQLNQTASFIWRSCDEAPSTEEIAKLLVQEFDVEEHVALRDVIETLGRLRALNLILEA